MISDCLIATSVIILGAIGFFYMLKADRLEKENHILRQVLCPSCHHKRAWAATSNKENYNYALEAGGYQATCGECGHHFVVETGGSIEKDWEEAALRDADAARRSLTQ